VSPADDMGLGKTRQSSLALSHARPEGLYLVICPASVKEAMVAGTTLPEGYEHK
jgi:SNF2 family DNA or RNA helicase